MGIDLVRWEREILAGGLGRGGVGGVDSSRATTSSSRAVGTTSTDRLPDTAVQHKREMHDQQQAVSFGRKINT